MSKPVICLYYETVAQSSQEPWSGCSSSTSPSAETVDTPHAQTKSFRSYFGMAKTQGPTGGKGARGHYKFKASLY